MIRLPGGWFLSDDEAATLATVRPHEDAWWRRNGAVTPAPISALLAALTGPVVTGGTGQVPRGSAQVPRVAPAGSEPPPSSWPSTRAVANELGMSTRAVVKAIEAGALRAARVGRGHPWSVEPLSVREYAEQRKRRRGDERAAA